MQTKTPIHGFCLPELFPPLTLVLDRAQVEQTRVDAASA